MKVKCVDSPDPCIKKGRIYEVVKEEDDMLFLMIMAVSIKRQTLCRRLI